jgi:hypothetical protein
VPPLSCGSLRFCVRDHEVVETMATEPGFQLAVAE